MNKKFLQTSALLLSLASMPVANAVTLENQSSYDPVTIYLIAWVGTVTSYQTSNYTVYSDGKGQKVSADEEIDKAWNDAHKQNESIDVAAYVVVEGVQWPIMGATEISLELKADRDAFKSDHSKLIFTGLNQQQNQAQFEYQPYYPKP